MPQLVHEYLTLATRGGLELRIASDDLKALERRAQRGQRMAVLLSLAASLLVCGVAAMLSAPDLSHSRVSVVAVAAIVAAALALIAAWRKS